MHFRLTEERPKTFKADKSRRKNARNNRIKKCAMAHW